MNDRFIGSISDVINLLDNNRRYDNIILCIWHNKQTYKSVITNDPKCKHPLVEDCVCQRCGGFVGHFGNEAELQDTYEHIYWLTNKLHGLTKRILIKSSFHIPTDYTQRLTKMPSKWKTITSHHLYDRIIPMSNLNSTYNGNCFLTIYQDKDMPSVINASSLYAPNLCIFDILLEQCLIVNPDIDELRHAYTKNFLICNSGIYERLREVVED